ncbi:hypothetical protein MAMC_01280 [Methylacidimicrobium cyclopophantes]|uniref:CRISPR type III-B/RAMP module-associated protein Cmr5 n=1 Tax=Methylacidimicrobium cyclopophantes TaxID=1041766 RepID=A0A5E6MEZ7_9BACT|nr:type III-B CRISPR module-associated protein Cmr5 [Methylacidimicrobium cyclopophantes]VVM06821.1 hypothetical protein MAMC_01280 [Methylacidimicrobium cyclopophantes]
MKNLEQQRAQHAFGKSRDLKRQDVNKLPALILGNGLLAATAFATDGDLRKGMANAMNAIADHLAKSKLIDSKTASEMLKELAEKDSLHLRLATEEALAYLVYLKRFAKQGKDDEAGSET